MNESHATSRSKPNPNRYHSYLLRLWRPGLQAAEGWRASVEDLETGERAGFASVDELLVFLARLSENEGKGAADDQIDPESDRACHSQELNYSTNSREDLYDHSQDQTNQCRRHCRA